MGAIQLIRSDDSLRVLSGIASGFERASLLPVNGNSKTKVTSQCLLSFRDAVVIVIIIVIDGPSVAIVLGRSISRLLIPLDTRVNVICVLIRGLLDNRSSREKEGLRGEGEGRRGRMSFKNILSISQHI